MKIETGKPETKVVCDWCKVRKNVCFTNCFLCHRDVCHPCEDKIGMSFKYSWPFANRIWVCGECQSKNKDDYLLGMLWQMLVYYEGLSRYHNEIEKLAKVLTSEIDEEMKKRGLKEVGSM